MLDGVEFLEGESVDRSRDRVHTVIEIKIPSSKQLAQLNLNLMSDVQSRQCIITYVDNNDV